MADDLEKTEEPTPKKIEDAKKEGNVPKSMDTSGFLTLLVAVLTVGALFGWLLERVQKLYGYLIAHVGLPIDKALVFEMSLTLIKEVALIVLPIAIPIAIAGVLAGWSQFGILFTTKPLAPDLKKIDPIKGFKNLFSLKKLVEGFKVTLKVLVVLGAAFFVFLSFLKDLATVVLFDLPDQLEWLVERAMLLAAVMLVLLFILAIIDLLFVRYNYFKGLRMSKQEIKDEMKQLDGNPEIKAKIRRLQMQMAKKRMLAQVPQADVVITNPTHYAVALRYNTKESRAPRVVAKGADLMALRIKEIAREHDVAVVENPPLARELYRQVDLDHDIPEKLYQAVAEVLAFVYKNRQS